MALAGALIFRPAIQRRDEQCMGGDAARFDPVLVYKSPKLVFSGDGIVPGLVFFHFSSYTYRGGEGGGPVAIDAVRLQLGKEKEVLEEIISNKGQQSADGNFLSHVANGVAKSLALKLGARILIGEFKEGQRLPAERNLARDLAVSRTTLRRGLDILEASGLIVRRPGSGTFISYGQPDLGAPGGNDEQAAAPPPSSDTEGAEASETLTIDIAEIIDISSPLELIVVRSILEPENARLAVINMSSKDIFRLGAIIERMDAITTDAAAFSRCDEELYMCIAEGTHNPLLSTLYKVVTIVRRSSSHIESREKSLSPNRIREYKKKHHSLYRAIRSRDIESAVEFVKLQMTEVQRDLMRDF